MKRNFRNNKILFCCGALFVVLGIWMLVIGIGKLVSLYSLTHSAMKVTGFVSEIASYIKSDGDYREEHYAVQVLYEVEGKEYTSYLDYYSSAMYEGYPIDIWIDSQDYTFICSADGELISGWGVNCILIACDCGGIGYYTHSLY